MQEKWHLAQYLAYNKCLISEYLNQLAPDLLGITLNIKREFNSFSRILVSCNRQNLTRFAQLYQLLGTSHMFAPSQINTLFSFLPELDLQGGFCLPFPSGFISANRWIATFKESLRTPAVAIFIPKYFSSFDDHRINRTYKKGIFLLKSHFVSDETTT